MGVTQVILGSSHWRDYQFLLPATALLWRERIGFEPYLFLTGEWDNERGRITQRALEGFGFELERLETPAGMTEVTLAQNCRQLAAALPFPDLAWLMPSDADLWPIRKDFYYQHETAPIPVHVLDAGTAVAYYANGDHYQSYPTCHFVLRTRDWRRLYTSALLQGNVTASTLAAFLDWKSWSALYARAADKNLAVWCSDQWQMSERAEKAVAAGTLTIRHIERTGHPPPDRIDRNSWPPDGYAVKDYVDAHAPKAPEEEKNWPRTEGLFRQLLPQRADWFADYRARYAAAPAVGV